MVKRTYLVLPHPFHEILELEAYLDRFNEQLTIPENYFSTIHLIEFSIINTKLSHLYSTKDFKPST